MKAKIKKYIKEVLIFTVVMVVFANAISLYRSLDLNKESLNIFSVTTLNDINYKLPTDRPILIHFWGSWCPVCKAEAGNIETVSKYYEVITVALKSGSDKDIQKYLDERDLNFRVVNDKNGYLTNKFGVSIFPTTIIYDKNREVVFSDVGYTSTWGLLLRMWYSSL